MSIRLIITAFDGYKVIADIPEWNGPVPSQGDYIHRPADGQGMYPDSVMTVKSVSWGIIARPASRLAGEATRPFTAASEPFAEVHV